MKTPKYEELTEAERWEYVMQKLDRIDRTLNPPMWKSGLHWIFNHWVLITGLLALGYGLWQIWTVVQVSLDFLQSLTDSMSRFGTNVTTPVKNLIEDVDLDTFRFW